MPSAFPRISPHLGLCEVPGRHIRFIDLGCELLVPSRPSLRILSHTPRGPTYTNSAIHSIPAMSNMNPMTRFEANPPESRTFARQSELPKLPIPPLEETCRRYLRALEGLQDPKEHVETKRAVDDFLQHDGPRVQERLKEYAKDKARCVCFSTLGPALLPLTFTMTSGLNGVRATRSTATSKSSGTSFLHICVLGRSLTSEPPSPPPSQVRVVPLALGPRRARAEPLLRARVRVPETLLPETEFRRCMRLATGTIPLPIEVSSFPAQPRSSCLRWTSSMICVRGCSSPTTCAGRRSTWTSIPGCSGLLGYPQTCAISCSSSLTCGLTLGGAQRGCKMETHGDSRHVVILRRGQFCELFLRELLGRTFPGATSAYERCNWTLPVW